MKAADFSGTIAAIAIERDDHARLGLARKPAGGGKWLRTSDQFNLSALVSLDQRCKASFSSTTRAGRPLPLGIRPR
jgi:hypothetical protein